MKRLDELMEQIKATEQTANLDVEGMSWQTRPGLEMAKREAKDKLEVLLKNYNSWIQEATVGIFVLGPGAEKFAKISSGESEQIITVQADGLYRKLAEAAEPALGKARDWNTNAHAMMLRTIGDIAKDLEVRNFLSPGYRDVANLKTTEDVVEHVRNLVRATLGDDLNRISLNKEISKKALASRYTNSVLPVIVIGLSGNEEAVGLESICFRFGTKISVGEDVTREFVLETFGEVKKKIRKQPKTE